MTFGYRLSGSQVIAFTPSPETDPEMVLIKSNLAFKLGFSINLSQVLQAVDFSIFCYLIWLKISL